MYLVNLFKNHVTRVSRSDFFVGLLALVTFALYSYMAFDALFSYVLNALPVPITPELLHEIVLTLVVILVAFPFTSLAAKRMHDWGSRASIVYLNLALAVVLFIVSGFQLPFLAMGDGLGITNFYFAAFSVNAIFSSYIVILCLAIPSRGEEVLNGWSSSSFGPITKRIGDVLQSLSASRVPLEGEPETWRSRYFQPIGYRGARTPFGRR